MSDTFEPVEIDPRDRPLLEKVGGLRVRAWATAVPDLPARLDCWLDEFELTSRHWCIFHAGEPVAAARLSVHQRIEDASDADIYAGVFAEPLPPPIASINQLVTHPDFRGRGFSDALDAVRLAAAEQMGCRCCVVNISGQGRLRQLRALGFEEVGSVVPRGEAYPFNGLPSHVVFRRLMSR